MALQSCTKHLGFYNPVIRGACLRKWPWPWRKAVFSSAGYHGLMTECLLPAALLGPGEIIPSFPERSKWPIVVPATAVNKVVDRWTFWDPRTQEMGEGSWHAEEGGIGNQVSESPHPQSSSCLPWAGPRAGTLWWAPVVTVWPCPGEREWNIGTNIHGTQQCIITKSCLWREERREVRGRIEEGSVGEAFEVLEGG